MALELTSLGSPDYPAAVELGLEPEPDACGEVFLEETDPAAPVEIVPQACAECGGQSHLHCLACRSLDCRHVMDLIRRLVHRAGAA